MKSEIFSEYQNTFAFFHCVGMCTDGPKATMSKAIFIVQTETPAPAVQWSVYTVLISRNSQEKKSSL